MRHTPADCEPTSLLRRSNNRPSRLSPRAAPHAPFVSKPSGQKTASGFECPEPQPKLPVTSKELNLFVWSEYVPQDMLDCFEKVYGITINRSEYSSNEEMYAKLAQGSSQFDLAQPSDYIIEVMIRTGILDKLDKGQLPNLKNIAPNLAQSSRRSQRRLHRAVSRPAPNRLCITPTRSRIRRSRGRICGSRSSPIAWCLWTIRAM